MTVRPAAPPRRRVRPLVERALQASALLLALLLLFERSLTLMPLIFLGVVAIFAFLMWYSEENRRRYRTWMVYVGCLGIFVLLRPLADETGLPVHTADLADLERLLFGGVVPTVWLQEQLFSPRNIGWLEWLATNTHWSYFIIPHLMTILVFLFRPRDFDRQALVIIGIFVSGLLLYFVTPATPPWLAGLRGDIPYVYRVMPYVGGDLGGRAYAELYRAFGDSNPLAAIPSMHMGVTFGLYLLARQYSRRLGYALLAYTLLMGFSLVYLGEHYVVDLLVGVGLAWVVFRLVQAHYGLPQEARRPVAA